MKVVYNGERPKGFTSTQILVLPIVVAAAIFAVFLVWNMCTKDQRLAEQAEREAAAAASSAVQFEMQVDEVDEQSE